jgi:hypothetical protein
VILVWEIYKITRIFDGAVYYGQHLNYKYPSDDGYMGSGKYLKRSINKYGKEAHLKEVIALAYSKAEADEYEISVIYNARKSGETVMNLSNGGDGTAGFFEHFTPEEQEAFRQKCIKSLIGRLVSEETRRKIRQSHRGMKHTEEGRIKSGNGARGRKHTQEELDKMSNSRKGYETPEETRKKISAANKGKIRSPEFRSHCSSIRRNYYLNLTEEQKKEQNRKRSESCKKAWEKYKAQRGVALS